MARVNTYTFATYSYPVATNTNPGTTASGTTIELISVYIPGNLFRVGDTVELSFLISDTTSANSGQKICYWNSGTTSTSGAVYVASWISGSTTAGLQPVTRFIHIASPTQSFIGATTSSYLTQMSATLTNSTEQTAALTTINIDWSVSGYFFVRGSVTGDRGQYIYVNRK
jgi:hypothetical protein